MKILNRFMLFASLLISLKGRSQTGREIEGNFLEMRKLIMGIGTVINDTILVDKRKVGIKKFVTVGTGLMTYARYDTILLYNIVTAGHVIKFFIQNKIKSIFLRPSWADTIKTSDYFGVEIPLINLDNTPNIFLYPEDNIDLGCILMPPAYFNTLYLSKITQEPPKVFPYNSMTIPYLGDQVWIGGYPGHSQKYKINFYTAFLPLNPVM